MGTIGIIEAPVKAMIPPSIGIDLVGIPKALRPRVIVDVQHKKIRAFL